MHLSTTLLLVLVLSYLLYLQMDSGDASDRGVLIRTGLIYALVSVSYAPLILYTPKPGEQTIRIDENTMKDVPCCKLGDCLKWTKRAKSPAMRHLCAAIYTLGCGLQGVSMYAIFEASQERLGSE